VLPPFVSRWPYLAAVALIAASVSDLAVEAIANAGAFGGAYFDTDDSSIVPALIAAMILAAGVIGRHMAAACARPRTGRRDWLANVAADVAGHAPLRHLRCVFGLQFAALFVMENAEQYLAHGHSAGGLLWLGGPPVVSIAIHVAVGLACTLGAGWLMRVSVPRFASLVYGALAFVLCARNPKGRACFIVRRSAAAFHQTQAARSGRISGRAPPFLLLPI
jgi:hypothetical protein